jgi:hypothetical protein
MVSSVLIWKGSPGTFEDDAQHTLRRRLTF